ncbi:MAG: hypothetical protein LH631_01345 [Alkalinema sp. CAN_BIN05]|nr:hypothetical protein [Alkalinema sp. CAN_BIN05]
MKTVETTVKIGADRTLSVQLPTDIAVGEYEVVLILNQSFQPREIPAKIDTPEMTAIQKIQSLLKQSIEPGYSFADELVRERHETKDSFRLL